MASLGDLILKLGVNAREFDKGLGTSMRKLNTFGKNTKKLGKSLTTSLTLPLAAIGGASFKVAADFEASMAQVKAVSGATADEFKMLEQNALDLGSSTKFTASEVSGLQLEFSKLGFSAQEITKVTESTLALAQATGSDLATSAEVAGATLRGFGLDASETARVTDVMAASFSSTALDMSSFQDSMKFVAPVAKSAGISIEQTTAMLGALANNGIKGSQAGTALRRIISELGATGGDVATSLQALSNEGLNLADAKDEVGRSAQSALLVLMENIGVTEDLTKSFDNAAGTAKEMAGIMDDTSAGALARMRSALEGAGIEIGKVLAPLIIELAGFVSDLANKFKNLDDGTKKIILVIGGLAAALGPILVAVPSLIAGFGKLRLAFAAMTGPVGLVVAGLAGSVIAIKELIDFSKSFKTSGQIMADTMSDINAASKKQTIQAEALVDMYGKETTSLEDRKRILDELKSIDEKHFGNLKAENLTLVDLNKSLEAYIANTKQLAMEKTLAAEGAELYNDLADAEIGLFDAQVKVAEERRKLIEKGLDPDKDSILYDYQALKGAERDLRGFQNSVASTSKAVEEFENRKAQIYERFGRTVSTVTEDVVENVESQTEAVEETTTAVEKLGSVIPIASTPLTSLAPIANDTKVEFKELGESTEGLTSKLTEWVNPTIMMFEQFHNAVLTTLKGAVGGLVQGGIEAAMGARTFAEGVLAPLADLAVNLGQLAIGYGVTIKGIKKALQSLNPVAAIGAGFLLIALGVGLKAAVSKAGEDADIPALAEGGIVSGRSLVEVGEYSGVQSNPEVIAPLDKLRSMIGGASGGQVQVQGVIRGRDIFLTNEIASREVSNIRAF